MLKKFILLKNIGRFVHAQTRGGPLTTLTLIYGANGMGKSTLVAVLRSLKTGDPTPIMGRKALAGGDDPCAEILFGGEVERFGDGAWSRSRNDLEIFDSVFVSDNVHSGEAIDISHRRSLYEVIIGEDGTRLAKRHSELAAERRSTASELRGHLARAEAMIPTALTLDEFLELPQQREIDAKIAAQEVVVRRHERAATLRERGLLPTWDLPGAFAHLDGLLQRSLDGISADAESRVRQHMAEHAMHDTGHAWLSQGMTYTSDDTCPFCGQDIRGLDLLNSFRVVFSDEYGRLQSSVRQMLREVDGAFGGEAVERLRTHSERLRAARDFWSEHVEIDVDKLVVQDSVEAAMTAYREAATSLLDKKRAAPLSVLQPSDDLEAANLQLGEARRSIESVNSYVTSVNDRIMEIKSEIGEASASEAHAELERLRATAIRHSSEGDSLCQTIVRLREDVGRLETDEQEARDALNRHSTEVIAPFEECMNGALSRFNAGFRLTSTRIHYPSGQAATTFKLQISDHEVDLGDSGTPATQQSFKNTLSSGDKSTLALAFFLAKLDHDPAFGEKIVVLDDPFTSQDAFRRRQTIQEVLRVAARARQVVVLSHDLYFLRDLWEAARPDQRVAMELADHRWEGSQLVALDIREATMSRTRRDLRDLQAYVTRNEGDPHDVVVKLRRVLEAWCRSSFPFHFDPPDHLLGGICRAIEEGEAEHPAAHILGELQAINDYSRAFHHGEDDTTARPPVVDAAELSGYVDRTLKLVQAHVP